MAEVGYRPELGICTKCGMMKVQENEVVKCIVCDAPKGTSTLVNRTADPGEAVFDRDPARLMEKKIGAAPQTRGGSLPPPPVKPPVAAHNSPVEPNGDLSTAIKILSSLPMPKDIKQFKAINKAIKILEGISNV